MKSVQPAGLIIPTVSVSTEDSHDTKINIEK